MIDEKYLRSWQEYKDFLTNELFENFQTDPRTFLFRGQGDSEWPLKPSFDRAFENFEGENRNSIENALLENFKKECKYSPEHRDLENIEIITALGRHYGLPTRLLDWTESPYFAAFFAFQARFYELAHGKRPEENVAIWVLNTKSYIWTEQNGVRLLSPEDLIDKRFVGQQGWFTLSKTPFQSLEDYVRAFSDADDALIKIVLPSGVANEAMKDLYVMGITAISLYPDLQGMVMSAVIKTLLNAVYE